MSTTDERSSDAAPTTGDGVGWAVPGVDGASSQQRGPAGSEPAACEGLSPEGSEACSPEKLRQEVAEAGSVHPIVTAMLTCLEALEGVRGVSAGTLTAREIRLMLLAVVQVITVAFAVKMRLLVAGEAQRVADLTGATSTAAFLSHLTQTKRSEASAQVRLAKDLDRRFPLLGGALAAGRLSPEQVRVCVSALRRLPKDLPTEKLAECQRFLVEAAQRFAPDQLKRVGRRLWEVVDPDGAEAKDGKALEDEEELARAKAYFRSWRNGDGTTGFRGKLPDLQADMLLKAIQAFASPRRRSNPNIPTGQPDDLAHPHPEEDEDECEGVGEGEDESPEERETGRVIPYPVKLGHGLMDLIERIPGDLLPSSGGVAATVNVTMRLDQLRAGLGVATVDTGIETSAAQARRLACEAGLVPMVLGGDSEILDVGRERRLHTKAQRRGMAVRDGTCVTVGCDRPASWAEAHHPHTWEEGGKTSLTNGALVCPYHHRLWHSSRWTALWNGRTVRFRRKT